MKFSGFIFIFIYTLQLLFADSSDYISKFKNIDLSKLDLHDLQTGKSASLANFSSDYKDIELWSINCMNCLWQIEDRKYLKQTILVNVDEDKSDILKAIKWLKEKGVESPSLQDVSQSIKKLIGSNYPIPVVLKFTKNKVLDAKFGYWRPKN